MEGTVVVMSVGTENYSIPKPSSIHLCPKFAPDWLVPTHKDAGDFYLHQGGYFILSESP